MISEELEARMKVLEDIEAIRKLRAHYCYNVDAERLEELLSLFTEDARLDFGLLGTHEGKEAVSKFFRDIVAGILSYSRHMVHNPIIEVDGDKATGRWYFEVPCTLRGTDMAVWLAGTYEEKYVKERGEWKFSFIKATFDYATPYEEGWAKTPFFNIA